MRGKRLKKIQTKAGKAKDIGYRIPSLRTVLGRPQA
jgi:hypothetical protein